MLWNTSIDIDWISHVSDEIGSVTGFINTSFTRSFVSEEVWFVGVEDLRPVVGISIASLLVLAKNTQRTCRPTKVNFTYGF